MADKIILTLVCIPILGVAQMVTPKIANGIFRHEVFFGSTANGDHEPLEVYWKVSPEGQSVFSTDSAHLFFKMVTRSSTNFNFLDDKYYKIDHFKKTISLISDSSAPSYVTKRFIYSMYAVAYLPKLVLADSEAYVAGVLCNHYLGDTLVRNPMSNEMVKLHHDVYVAKYLYHPKPVSHLLDVLFPLTIPNNKGIVMFLNITDKYGINWFSTKCVQYVPDTSGILGHPLPDYPQVPLMPKYPSTDSLPKHK